MAISHLISSQKKLCGSLLFSGMATHFPEEARSVGEDLGRLETDTEEPWVFLYRSRFGWFYSLLLHISLFCPLVGQSSDLTFIVLNVSTGSSQRWTVSHWNRTQFRFGVLTVLERDFPDVTGFMGFPQKKIISVTSVLVKGQWSIPVSLRRQLTQPAVSFSYWKYDLRSVLLPESKEQG